MTLRHPLVLDAGAIVEMPVGDAIGVEHGGTGSTTAAAARAALGVPATTEVRLKWLSQQTLYVATTGSDTTGDGTSGNPFLTVNKAISTLVARDLGGLSHIIQLADGTYTTSVTCQAYTGGAGPITIRGNTTTPSNVVISVTASHVIYNGSGCQYNVSGMKLQTTSGACISTSLAGSVVVASYIDFGAATAAHLYAVNDSIISLTTAYTISAGGTGLVHLYAATGGRIITSAYTVTILNTPVFLYWVYAYELGDLQIYSTVWSGAIAAGCTKYALSLNSVCNVFGAGASYLPGSIAGTTSSGGQYA